LLIYYVCIVITPWDKVKCLIIRLLVPGEISTLYMSILYIAPENIKKDATCLEIYFPAIQTLKIIFWNLAEWCKYISKCNMEKLPVSMSWFIYRNGKFHYGKT